MKNYAFCVFVRIHNNIRIKTINERFGEFLFIMPILTWNKSPAVTF